MPVLFEADDDQPEKNPDQTGNSPTAHPSNKPSKEKPLSTLQNELISNTDTDPKQTQEPPHTADSLFPESEHQIIEQSPNSGAAKKPKPVQNHEVKDSQKSNQETPHKKVHIEDKRAPMEKPITERPENTDHPEHVAINLIRQRRLPLPERSSFGLMGAFVTAPKNVFFATQSRGEVIVLYLRKHPITQLPWILFTFFLIIAPPFLFPMLGIFFPFELPASYTLIFTILWYMIIFALSYARFILWYYDINIVTNNRIVDIDFYYLLTQEVKQTRITQLEDVTYTRIGLWATVFDYGNILVQTAGAEANIDFLRVPDPKRVTQTLIRLMGSVPTQ